MTQGPQKLKQATRRQRIRSNIDVVFGRHARVYEPFLERFSNSENMNFFLFFLSKKKLKICSTRICSSSSVAFFFTFVFRFGHFIDNCVCMCLFIKRQAGGLPRQFASDVLPVGSIYSVTPDVC